MFCQYVIMDDPLRLLDSFTIDAIALKAYLKLLDPARSYYHIGRRW